MSSLLQTFIHSVKARFSDENDSSAPELGKLDLRINPQLTWSLEEFDFLSQYEQQRRLCRAKIVGQHETYQTFILGFDVQSNQIMLDNLFPSPAYQAEVIGRHLELELRHNDSTLVLDAIPECVINLRHGAAIQASMFDKNIRHDRRREARVSFSPKEAPAAILHVPLEPKLDSTVVNLSSEGMLVKNYGHLPLSLIRANLSTHVIPADCQIQFSGGVKFRCDASIRHIDFHRRPCNHSLIRVTFDNVSHSQRDIITTFLAASAEKSAIWHDTVCQAF